MAVMTPEGVNRMWSDGAGGLISKHSGFSSDNISGGIVVRANYSENEIYGSDIVDHWGILECDPRAEVFAYHTDGRISGDGDHDVDDGSSKIIGATISSSPEIPRIVIVRSTFEGLFAFHTPLYEA